MEGNQMKMREALVNIAGYAETARCHTEDAHVLGYLEQIEKWANEALSEPARQCDVGNPEEQMERFREFCRQEKCGRYRCRSGCKAICIERCAIDWAQAPYEAQEGAWK